MSTLPGIRQRWCVLINPSLSIPALMQTLTRMCKMHGTSEKSRHVMKVPLAWDASMTVACNAGVVHAAGVKSSYPALGP